jgi:hypothetical protein
MKKLILPFVFLMLMGCIHKNSFEKPVAKSPFSDTLIDESENRYYLDTARMIICKYTKNEELLWKTDPWEENNLIVFGGPHPKIVKFRFGIKSQSEFVVFMYNTHLGGALNKSDGKFTLLGKD